MFGGVLKLLNLFISLLRHGGVGEWLLKWMQKTQSCIIGAPCSLFKDLFCSVFFFLWLLVLPPSYSVTLQNLLHPHYRRVRYLFIHGSRLNIKRLKNNKKPLLNPPPSFSFFLVSGLHSYWAETLMKSILLKGKSIRRHLLSTCLKQIEPDQ